MDTEKLKSIARQLRNLASRRKTIYGGSDFAPVDYQVLTASPSELNRLLDELDAVIMEGTK